MDLEENQISFICMNSSFDYKDGKLKLALPFYCEYGNFLPEKLKLRVKTGAVWEGNYVRGSFYIDGLGSMMRYYGLRACHLAILQYVGGSDFNVKFYNPYVVEMKYETEIGASVVDDLCTAIEEDRLCSTFLCNAFHNFLGLYNMHIKSKHLLVENDMKVISEYGCYRLRLNDSVRSIRFCFEDHERKIKVKWLDGECFFSKNWPVFVKAANIVVGDVVAFYKTDTPFKFKVAIFDRKTSSEQPLLGVISFDSLEDGELCNILDIELGGGYSTNFKYCPDSKRIYGLHRFFGKYNIDDEYVIFFNYLGNSKFAVSVYDCQHMNHLRNIVGDFRFEDFLYPPCDTEVIVVSDNDENHFEDDDDLNVDSSDSSSDSSSSTTSNIEQDNEEIVANQGMTFNVNLMKSHVDQQGHEVYIPRLMWHVYQNWGRRTTVTLIEGGREWDVDVLRNKKSCRFGKGWDDLVKV
ncbi:hypothetical protein POM88_000471 [Heracleum sosnowskyi]|uniref:TF-B3 domain-containing protein n=1 Tax=Heracleum sosnowskyi TaxID=360622 RepID=A0AAD8JBY0_9APIA|nr:hypothetical protein POM88_000471 [Heracleum sosnowskyi]